MKKPIPWAKIFGWVLFVSLVASILFAGHRVATTPSDATAGTRLKSDYVLMLTQCVLALVVMFLPGLLQKRLRIEIPNYIFALYFLFLYCAVYLGEVRDFYYRVPHWDSYLHYFSAAMLGALGFSLVSILNDDPNLNIRLSPLFVGIFAFCFALAAGAIWEIYEFSLDGLLGMNMQKYRLEDGTVLCGRAALADTMKDIIVDSLGALLVSVLGVLTIKRKRQS